MEGRAAMMRILFVASGKKDGKPGPIVRNQSDALRKHGLDISLFLINGGGFINYFKAVFKLRKKLNEEKFDLIHAHYALCGITALAARHKHKVVVSFMGDDLIGSCRQDGSLILISRLFVKLNYFLIRNLIDHSIVKSDRMLPASLINRKNISVVPNGVDIECFYPVSRDKAIERLGWDTSETNVVFASNPARPEKNFNLAREAVKMTGDISFKLRVVHEVENSEMKYIFSAADMLLMTSFHEGSPNVVKEAMACNCPVVTTDVGDARNLLDECEGCFVTSYDPGEIANRIKEAAFFRKTKVETSGRSKITEKGLDSNTVSGFIGNIYKNVLCAGSVE